MNTTLPLVALVVFAFAISRVLTRYASRYFVVSGVEYIVLGVLLGPGLLVLHTDAFHAFKPLIDLLLGLVGFVLGLRAREALIRPRVAIGAVVSALLVIAVTGAACLALIEAIGEGARAVTYGALPLGDRLLIVAASPDNLRLAGTVGCCAAVSSPVLISDSARVLRARGPALEALRGQGLVSQLVAVAAFGGIMASARATESAAQLQISVALWAACTALFGILCGFLFSQFIGSERGEMRIYIAAVGVVTFASGIGVALGVSPLVVNLIAGICVSYSSGHAAELERTLVRLRHPVLVLIRVFAGAAWVGVRGLAWLLPPLYAVVRLGVRRGTSYAAVRAGGVQIPRLPRMGVGLVGQGGVAVAIALSFAMRFPDRAGVVLTVVLGGVVLSDLWSYRAVRRVLADAGELHTIDPSEQAQLDAAEAQADAHHHHAPDGADDATLAHEGEQLLGRDEPVADGSPGAEAEEGARDDEEQGAGDDAEQGAGDDAEQGAEDDAGDSQRTDESAEPAPSTEAVEDADAQVHGDPPAATATATVTAGAGDGPAPGGSADPEEGSR